MRRLLPLVFVALLSACANTAPRTHMAASDVREIDSLAAIAPALAESHARSLLVLDIDDTLLTSDGFFGSDKWYEWQKHLPKDDPGKVPCLFDVIALNYEAATQHPTQPDGPDLINAVRADKLLLTSRNPLYRGGTVRTLHDNHYALPAMLGTQVEGRSWDVRKDVTAKPVHVEYDQGLFMTSGQNKGVMLVALLNRLNLHYQRVLLVDDGQANIDAMRAALRTAGIGYLGLRYTRIDKTISDADANAGRAGWQAWRQLLATTYPQRLQAFEQGQCGY